MSCNSLESFLFRVFSSNFVNQLDIRPFLFSPLVYFSCCQVSSELSELSINCSRIKRFILSEFTKEYDSLLFSRFVISVPFRLNELGFSTSFFILHLVWLLSEVLLILNYV